MEDVGITIKIGNHGITRLKVCSQLFHKPVMAEEVIEFLRLKVGSDVLDATVGCGGHSDLILKKIAPRGLLIGIDRDQKSLEIAEKRLRESGGMRYELIHANFRDVDDVLSRLGIKGLDGALFDLGISSFQLGDAARGFSFERDGFLDMRMDLSQGANAYNVINSFKRRELEEIIREFGEERYWRRITDFIINRRPVQSTAELADIVRKAVGGRYRSQRIHPATRTFQALRIAVNDELGSLKDALTKTINLLKRGARICVISFHSLEDRIVKNVFRDTKNAGGGALITKKPLRPGAEEMRDNSRSRSAKLRVLERVS